MLLPEANSQDFSAAQINHINNISLSPNAPLWDFGIDSSVVITVKLIEGSRHITFHMIGLI